MLSMIECAQRMTVLDQFLFNDLLTDAKPVRNICQELTSALVRKQRTVPDIRVYFVTDPCNTLYGALRSSFLETLRQKASTSSLPTWTSSPVYSLFWRLLVRRVGNRADGHVPNPFDDKPVTLRSLLHIPNMKANHRKSMIADDGDDWVGLVSTINPHDASHLNRNVALQFNGPAMTDLLHSEMAVISMSTGRAPHVCRAVQPLPTKHATQHVSIHSEGAIKETLLKLISASEESDQIDLILFYLPDLKVVSALLDAADRGVQIRVVLAPSKDAFGCKKIGIPNRPVASRLHRCGISVRLADPYGEQCHTKMALFNSEGGPDAKVWLLVGSANYTRRNLDNFNLECDVLLSGPSDSAAFLSAYDMFEDTWANRNGRRCTVDYGDYEKRSPMRHMICWCMEVTGISTF